MLSGKRLHLTAQIPAVDRATRKLIRLGIGEDIDVLSGPSNLTPTPNLPPEMIAVRWHDRTLDMFFADVKIRTVEITPTAKAS